MGAAMQYRTHRYLTQFPIQIATPAGRAQCHVIDVNANGARILGPRTLKRGDKVSFRVLNDDVTAVVCWSLGDRAGVMFRPALTSRQVDTLRYRRDGVQNRPRGSVGFASAHY